MGITKILGNLGKRKTELFERLIGPNATVSDAVLTLIITSVEGVMMGVAIGDIVRLAKLAKKYGGGKLG